MISTSEEIIAHEFVMCKYLDKMPKLKPKAIQDQSQPETGDSTSAKCP